MQIAVIIPAYNEEVTIADVVQEYKSSLPDAEIYVGDNNSRDKTAELARQAGAKVISCTLQGKGNAVRHMLETIKADIYIMVDGDATYSSQNIQDLIQPVLNGKADMVVGKRRQITQKAFSFLHQIGNALLTNLLNRVFKVKLQDILSGYRVMSRNMVDHLVLLAEGFEIETELTIRALQERYRIIEIPIEYRHRPTGSESKLNTWGDGFLILYTIFTLFRDYNPMVFFVILSIVFFILGTISGLYILSVYLRTSLMPHTGLAVITAMCILLSAIILMMGLLLDSFHNSYRLMRESIKRNRLLIEKHIDSESQT